MIWWQQNDHVSDCNFVWKITGFSWKSESKIIYPACKSAVLPVPYGSHIAVPHPSSGYDESLLSNRPSCADETDVSAFDLKIQLMLLTCICV